MSEKFYFENEKQKAVCLDTIRALDSIEREFRSEVMDPSLRLKKLKDMWGHGEFIVGWATKEVAGKRLKEIIDYQLMNINWTMESDKVRDEARGKDAQYLSVINAIFEIVSSLSRSAHAQVKEQEDKQNKLKEDFEKYMAEREAQEERDKK